MLTGKPPLGHLEPAAAIFRIGSRPIKPKLPENVSFSAKEFVKAALTWLVLFRKQLRHFARYDWSKTYRLLYRSSKHMVSDRQQTTRNTTV